MTEAGRREWETYKQYSHAVTSLFSQREQGGHDTVGAVARDQVGYISYSWQPSFANVSQWPKKAPTRAFSLFKG